MSKVVWRLGAYGWLVLMAGCGGSDRSGLDLPATAAVSAPTQCLIGSLLRTYEASHRTVAFARGDLKEGLALEKVRGLEGFERKEPAQEELTDAADAAGITHTYLFASPADLRATQLECAGKRSLAEIEKSVRVVPNHMYEEVKRGVVLRRVVWACYGPCEWLR